MRNNPLESEAYCDWEQYVEEHPEIEDIPSAKMLQQYEEDMTKFIIGLFK